jgi:methylation protein EvaC
MPQCLISGAEFEPFLSFGKMPVANAFADPDAAPDDFRFELEVGFCPESKMVQLTRLVDETRMFHDHYAFFSSTSAGMARHFEAFAADIRAGLGDAKDPFVVELGSNDGILLRHFADAGIRHLGVEPSANVAAAARERGVNTVSRFFNAETARDILAEHGPADAILGANVMCHIPYLHSVFEGVKRLLKPGGVLVFEDPYVGDIVRKTSFDQIYDEHVFYFSLGSVSHLAAMHGMEVVDVVRQPVHGGSMRYTLARAGERAVAPSVAALATEEEAAGLYRPETYARFAREVERVREELPELLRRLRREGKRITGYGATSKSTTVTNYCGITPELVEYITDTTPGKQGKLSPGARIPVAAPRAFIENPPEYALLFAWNHAEEILAKEKDFRERGGRFITYVPQVAIL